MGGLLLEYSVYSGTRIAGWAIIRIFCLVGPRIGGWAFIRIFCL